MIEGKSTRHKFTSTAHLTVFVGDKFMSFTQTEDNGLTNESNERAGVEEVLKYHRRPEFPSAALLGLRQPLVLLLHTENLRTHQEGRLTLSRNREV